MSKELEGKAERLAVRPARSSSAEIAAFVAKARKSSPPTDARANILFGLDLTASRMSTLVEARKATGAMLRAVARLPQVMGRAPAVAIKLAYYRGAECRVAKDWLTDPDVLCRTMDNLSCVGGNEQLPRLLACALREARSDRVSAMVFIGDHCFLDQQPELLSLAQEMKAAAIPLFVFHECHDEAAVISQPVFRRVAEATGGAYCAFNHSSGDVLCELLLNIAVYSAGGHDSLRLIDGPQTPEGRALRRALLELPPANRE